MASAAIAGYRGEFLFSTSTAGASTGLTAVAELRNFNLNITHTQFDATSHESSGAREKIGGIVGWTGTAESLHVMTNITHKNVADLIIARTQTGFAWYPTGSSSDGYYSGLGYISEFGVSSPTEDTLANNISIIGTGALTRTSSST